MSACDELKPTVTVLGGKQYVATTSGVVSGFFGGSGTSSIIVFALH